jgi:hypothetical protein
MVVQLQRRRQHRAFSGRAPPHSTRRRCSMNALNAADSENGDFALVSSSDGSEVEGLMRLLCAQVRQAGVGNLGGAASYHAEAEPGVLAAAAAVGESVTPANTAGSSGIFAAQQVFEGSSKPESLEVRAPRQRRIRLCRLTRDSPRPPAPDACAATRQCIRARSWWLHRAAAAGWRSATRFRGWRARCCAA